MVTRRQYEKDADRLTALEVEVGELRDDLREVRAEFRAAHKEFKDQAKWIIRTMIGLMVTLAGTLTVALLVFPHG